jgi:hypothetical protein
VNLACVRVNVDYMRPKRGGQRKLICKEGQVIPMMNYKLGTLDHGLLEASRPSGERCLGGGERGRDRDPDVREEGSQKQFGIAVGVEGDVVATACHWNPQVFLLKLDVANAARRLIADQTETVYPGPKSEQFAVGTEERQQSTNVVLMPRCKGPARLETDGPMGPELPIAIYL